MDGLQQLQAEALKPKSHFRKEWWLSCQRHHPGWVYVFWDEAACESLLQRQYPWFLETYRSLDKVVLKSDAMRPFILHAYGGVYLDMDSECFANMEPWITGPQLVLTAEVAHRLNNAQMAGVAGHPLWERYQRAIARNLQAGVTSPVAATGPEAFTRVVQESLNRTTKDLAGFHQLTDGTSMAVYTVNQWFTPCSWDDANCTAQLAYDKMLLRAKAAASIAAQAVSREPPVVAGQPEHGIPTMMHVPALAGAHHFSGSWTGWGGTEDKSNNAVAKGGRQGAADFLANGSSFVEQRCLQPGLLAGRVPVCWETIGADVAAGRCIVYSVRTMLHSVKTRAQQPPPLLAENELAKLGCEVHVVTTKEAATVSTVMRRALTRAPGAHSSVTFHCMDESQVATPFDNIELHLPRRITLLLLAYDDGALHQPGALDVINHLYTVSSPVLARAHMLVMELDTTSQDDRQKLYIALQHIHQEVGMLGFFHRRVATKGGSLLQLGYQVDQQLLQPC